MNAMQYIKLLRPKHYLKNILVFLPLIFSGQLLNAPILGRSILAFAAFSLVASAVYIINDIKDKDLDRQHPKKKQRPIASGGVSVVSASILAVVLLILAIGIQSFVNQSAAGYLLLSFYLLINIAYSYGLKNIPIIDITILSFGFVLRVFYGGDAIDVEVSNWLYLAVLAFSFYLGLGKRRNEIKDLGSATRKVNKFYNQDFLDKNMYVFLGLTIIYYSLWAIDPAQIHRQMVLSVPVVMVIVMAYSLAVEGGKSDGDPVNVVTGSKTLLALIVLFGILMVGIVYFS
jgi:4-hydroxybenzoate polyprenyltransferase